MSRNIIYKINKIIRKEVWPLREVKDYLRITHNYDDKIIDNLIESAVQQAEIFMGISLHSRHITLTAEKIDSFITFKYVPVIELVSITALSINNKDIKEEIGYLDIEKARLVTQEKFVGEDIKIEYLAGYQEIPRAILHGILNHIVVMYDRPDNIATLTQEVRNLYLPYRQLKLHV